MTNEEVERAIDFLLKSQANSEARIEQTNEQLNQLAEQLGSFADTQTEMMRVTIRFIESQTLTNDSTAARQARMEEAMVRLAEAQAQTERRLEALTKIVEEDRNSR
jgi:hypothetical protein